VLCRKEEDGANAVAAWCLPYRWIFFLYMYLTLSKEGITIRFQLPLEKSCLFFLATAALMTINSFSNAEYREKKKKDYTLLKYGECTVHTLQSLITNTDTVFWGGRGMCWWKHIFLLLPANPPL